jgi:hypothetical protein
LRRCGCIVEVIDRRIIDAAARPQSFAAPHALVELEGYLTVWQAMHPESLIERITPLAPADLGGAELSRSRATPQKWEPGWYYPDPDRGSGPAGQSQLGTVGLKTWLPFPTVSPSTAKDFIRSGPKAGAEAETLAGWREGVSARGPDGANSAVSG